MYDKKGLINGFSLSIVGFLLQIWIFGRYCLLRWDRPNCAAQKSNTYKLFAFYVNCIFTIFMFFVSVYLPVCHCFYVLELSKLFVLFPQCSFSLHFVVPFCENNFIYSLLLTLKKLLSLLWRHTIFIYFSLLTHNQITRALYYRLPLNYNTTIVLFNKMSNIKENPRNTSVGS